MRRRGTHGRSPHDVPSGFGPPRPARTAPVPARLAALAALVAALLAAALAGCSAGAGPAQGPQPATPVLEPTAEPSVEPPRVPSGTELPGQVISLDFSDERHGFALLADCPDAPPYTCAYLVASYAGDAAWRLARTPLPSVPPTDIDATIQAAGPGHARLSAVTHGAGQPSEAHAWLTTDGGGSWQATDVEPTGTSDRIPEGALVSTASPADGRLAVLLPDTAEYRLLEPQPPLAELGTPGRLSDGRYWVAGLDSDGDPAVAVWRPEGGGWRVLAPLPTAPGFAESVHHRQLQLALGPDGLYAFETGTANPEGGGIPGGGLYRSSLLGIHHSTDDGRTWERVWTHVDVSSRPATVFGSPIAAEDGTLVVYADDSIYVSADGGRTFTIARPGPPPEEPALTRAGYLLTDLDHPGHFRISADGFSWHTIVLGGEET